MIYVYMDRTILWFNMLEIENKVLKKYGCAIFSYVYRSNKKIYNCRAYNREYKARHHLDLLAQLLCLVSLYYGINR